MLSTVSKQLHFILGRELEKDETLLSYLIFSIDHLWS